MGTTPDELRTDVEARRSNLAHNVDLLTDRVAPNRIARRRVDSAKNRLSTVKDQVMGSADDTGRAARDLAGQAGDTAGQIGDAVQQAPARARRQTQGNPLAAGIIAFGAGMLAATLIPVSDAEQRAGAQLRENADTLVEPVKQAATDAVKHVTQEMREPAQDAVQSVKSTAQDAMQQTQDTSRQAAQETSEGLRQVGSDAVQQTRGQVRGR